MTVNPGYAIALGKADAQPAKAVQAAVKQAIESSSAVSILRSTA
jgi:hypothetical protein